MNEGKFKPGKPGFGCKNGKLYRFEKRSVLVFAPWPNPQAWFKSHRKGWHSSRKRADKVFSGTLFAKGAETVDLPSLDTPDLRVWCGDPAQPDPAEIQQFVERHAGRQPAGPQSILRLRQSVQERRTKYERIRAAILLVRRIQSSYFDAIPEEVRNELLRYTNRRWHLFSLFARCPGALDLSRSNPALCYALASNWVFHKPAVKSPMRAARSLIGKKQKHILDWLGFPGTETARRIMAKTDSKAFDILRMWRFRRALGEPEIVKWLSHMEQINLSVMELVGWRDYRPFISARLLTEVSQEEVEGRRRATAIRMFDDTLHMAGEMPEVAWPRPFSSLRQLEAVHDDLARQREHRWQREGLTCYDGPGGELLSFPKPPYAGTGHIQPILTPEDLHKEGQEMGHCVGIYDHRVARGQCFVYRVTDSVRATMEIIRSGNDGWIPGQLCLARNRPVPRPLAAQLFAELFASGKFTPNLEPQDSGVKLEEAGAGDPQLPLFVCDREGELVPF